MISRAIFDKNLPKSLTLRHDKESLRLPYLVSAASRPLSLRHPVPSPRHSVIHKRVHRGLELVSSQPPADSRHSKAWRFGRRWLDQKHLDRGFLFLAASSALLLLLSSR